MKQFIYFLQSLDKVGLPHSIEALQSATELDLSACDLRVLPDCFENLAKFANIKILKLHSNPNLVDVKPLQKLENLECLSLSHDRNIDLPNFDKLKSLKALHLRDVQLTNSELSWLVPQIKSVEILDISENDELVEIDCLDSLPKLNYLVVDEDIKIPACLNSWNFRVELKDYYYYKVKIYTKEQR